MSTISVLLLAIWVRETVAEASNAHTLRFHTKKPLVIPVKFSVKFWAFTTAEALETLSAQVPVKLLIKVTLTMLRVLDSLDTLNVKDCPVRFEELKKLCGNIWVVLIITVAEAKEATAKKPKNKTTAKNLEE